MLIFIQAGYSGIGGVTKTAQSVVPAVPKLPAALENLQVGRLVYDGSPFIRIAGLSGAAAVILGAYGAHRKLFNLFHSEILRNCRFYCLFTITELLPQEGMEERKRIYDTASRYHFIHTLALFGAPLSKHPKLVSMVLYN